MKGEKMGLKLNPPMRNKLENPLGNSGKTKKAKEGWARTYAKMGMKPARTPIGK